MFSAIAQTVSVSPPTIGDVVSLISTAISSRHSAGAYDEYADGVIDETELERILETTEDPETTRIQALVRPVNGVGPKTSWAIAEHFDSPDDLRDADQDEFEAIHGVGPSLSEAIVERFAE